MISFAQSVKFNIKCFAICAALATGTFQFGCDTSILNGLQATPGFLRVFGVPTPTGFVLQTTFQQLITSLLQVGLILASIVTGPFSKLWGRRAGFTVATILSYIGLTIQILVTDKGPIYLARIILGTANGMYVNLFILYSSEASPAHLRGSFVSVIQVFVSLGSVIGAVISNAFSTDLSKHSYQIQLIILYAIPTWLMAIVWFLPESPRWLAVRGRDEKARRCLIRLRNGKTPVSQIDFEMEEIKTAIRIEKEMAQNASLIEMWRGNDARRTLLTTACITFQAASGINFIIGYSTFFFQVAGVTSPFISSIITLSANLVAAIFSVILANEYGRRPLLLAGFSVTTITMFGVAILYTLAPHSSKAGKGLVALLAIYVGAYAGAIGPISWTAAGELPSNRMRSLTFGVGSAIGYFFAWLTTFTTPFFINPTALNLGAKVAWIWAPSNLITLIFIFFALPETKGRTLEELNELFYRRVPARKFKDFKMAEVDEAFGERRTAGSQEAEVSGKTEEKGSTHYLEEIVA